ncbi:MAG: LPS assembly lipoprotein LptE [Stellaceae bacterium]
MLAATPLAGCGFHPLYAGRTAGEYDPTLATIKVEPIEDREGQILELALREKLNPRGVSVPTRYTLRVVLSLSRADLGIQLNATSTRSEISAAARYTLSGKDINFSGQIHTVNAFNLQNDAWAATVAEDDARQRAIEELADAIYLQLSLWSQRRTAAR